MFGVAEAQVRRDHLISHILTALAALDVPIVFFGGTALARTHLSDPANGARLSEDIDLYSPARPEVAAILDAQLPGALRREYPGLRWDPLLSAVRSVVPGQLVSPDNLRVRVQLLDSRGEHHDLDRWPTEVHAVALRYLDTRGAVALRVPTLSAFAAMKTIAWLDRHAARDLYDLAGLAGIGALTEEAAELVHRATGWRPSPALFGSLPPLDWAAQLAHQTSTLPSARECLDRVRAAYAGTLDN